MRKQKNILLIDEDLMVRQALGQALAVENYHVVSAANRYEALREVGQHPIDVVLLDLNPRGENGQETLERLSALQPHLPVVAMTARPEQYEPNSKAHGVDVLLEKPLNLSVLLQTLNELTARAPDPRQQPTADAVALLENSTPIMNHCLNNKVIYVLAKLIANLCPHPAAIRSVALLLLLSVLNLFLPLRAAAAPVNDNFAYATVASGSSVTLTGSNVGATKETGEPNHAGNFGGKSAWWTWTAPAAGTVTITTFGSSFDTVLGVYTGTSVSALTIIASNDDSGSLQSRVAFTAAAGTTYRIAVDGYNGANGNITLNISQTTSSCTYSISTTSASVGSTASSGSVSVTTTSGCTWSASSSAAWITITSGASGSGNGTVYYSVAANTSTASRTGTLTIAGKTFTVSQAAAASLTCTYSISPTSASLASTASSGSVSVTTTTGCNWTAGSGAAWITITAGTSGSGNGTVYYSVTANTSTTSRSGTLTVAGKTFTVSQAAGATSCTYSISGSTASFGSAGGPGSVGVTAGSGCTWTVGSGVAWVTISSGSSGTGNGTVNYYVAANTGGSRSGILTIAGKTFTISQAGATPDAAPTASLTSPGNGATISGTATFTGTATDDVGVTRVEFWCDGSVLLGSANSAPYSIAYNTTTIANGSHTFICKSYDGAGHSTTSAAIMATVSNIVQSGGSWAKNVGGAGTDMGAAIATDANGYVFVTGYFSGTANCGGSTVNSAGLEDVLVAKYAPDGTLVWVKTFGGSGHDMAEGIAVDRYGDVIVTGSFQNTVSFGTSSYTSAGMSDLFVLKLSGSSGSVLWSKQVGFASNDKGHGVTTDPNNADVIVVGEVGYGSQDSLVLRYTASGNLLWSKSFDCGAGDGANGVAVDGQGNVLVTGVFLSAITFDASVGLQYATVATSYSDLYVVKLTAAGGYVWSKVFGGDGADQGCGIAVDSSGNVFVTGIFGTGAIDFGGGLLMPQSSNMNAFVLKLSGSNGLHLWSKGFSHPIGAQQYGNSLKVDDGNNVIVVGGFGQSCDFGGGNLISAGGNDVFAAAFTGAGAPLWSKRFGGSASDFAKGVAVRAGTVIVTGASSGGDFNGVALPTNGGLDAFTDKFTP